GCRVVSQGVAGLTVHAIDGLHAFAHRSLFPTEPHEVEADGAVVERVGRRATHHLASLRLARVGCRPVAQLDVAEMRGRHLRRQSGRVRLATPEPCLPSESTATTPPGCPLPPCRPRTRSRHPPGN